MGEQKRKAIYRQVQELNLRTNDERAAAFSAKWKRSEAAKKAAATRKANKEKWLSDPEVKKTIRENYNKIKN